MPAHATAENADPEEDGEGKQGEKGEDGEGGFEGKEGSAADDEDVGRRAQQDLEAGGIFFEDSVDALGVDLGGDDAGEAEEGAGAEAQEGSAEVGGIELGGKGADAGLEDEAAAGRPVEGHEEPAFDGDQGGILMTLEERFGGEAGGGNDAGSAGGMEDGIGHDGGIAADEGGIANGVDLSADANAGGVAANLHAVAGILEVEEIGLDEGGNAFHPDAMAKAGVGGVAEEGADGSDVGGGGISGRFEDIDVGAGVDVELVTDELAAGIEDGGEDAADAGAGIFKGAGVGDVGKQRRGIDVDLADG